MTTITLIRWTIAAIHLLALGLGLGAIWTRSRALPPFRPDQRRTNCPGRRDGLCSDGNGPGIGRLTELIAGTLW